LPCFLLLPPSTSFTLNTFSPVLQTQMMYIKYTKYRKNFLKKQCSKSTRRNVLVPVLPLTKNSSEQKQVSLSRPTNFRVRFPLSDIHRSRLHVGDVALRDNKSDRHKIRQVFIPPSPSVRTLAARQRMLQSKPPLTIFQTSISSKTLYPHPLQSNLGRVWGEPIKSLASIGRTNQILGKYRASQSERSISAA